jgi:hypothetical protein
MGHEDFHELTAAYALDSLDEQDELAYEEHLRTCPRCREDLAAVKDTAGLLAYGAAAQAPPPALRERILDDHGPTRGGDDDRAGGAVVERAGEHERDRGRTENKCNAAKERVDSGAVVVLVRTAHDADLFALGEEVEVRRRDVDPSGHEGLVITRMFRFQRANAIEDRGQIARRKRRHVEHDQHGSREIGRERSGEPGQRLDAAGRRPDGQDPRCQAGGHGLSLRGGASGAS